MNIIGTFDPFADTFPSDLLPWVFRIIFKEWDNFQRPDGVPLENRITKRFVGHLQSCKDIRPLPFFFDPLVKLVSPEKDTEKGELDIRVMHGRRPKVFFAFECKRLNVIRDGKYTSQAGDYVGMDGMGCFLSGKYDGGGDCGGMIGYVMDNDVEKALFAINKALKNNQKELKTKAPIELVKSDRSHPYFETFHSNVKTVFTIYHAILPYDPKH